MELFGNVCASSAIYWKKLRIYLCHKLLYWESYTIEIFYYVKLSLHVLPIIYSKDNRVIVAFNYVLGVHYRCISNRIATNADYYSIIIGILAQHNVCRIPASFYMQLLTTYITLGVSQTTNSRRVKFAGQWNNRIMHGYYHQQHTPQAACVAWVEIVKR